MVSCKYYPIATVECGEWGDEYPSIRLIGGSLDRKAEAYMDRIGYGKIPEDVARANAFLISAAPDLYTAGKAVLYHDERGQGIGYKEAMDALLAALNKAEGK